MPFDMLMSDVPIDHQNQSALPLDQDLTFVLDSEELFEPSYAVQHLETTPDGDISLPDSIPDWNEGVFSVSNRDSATVSISNVEMSLGGESMQRQTSLMSSVSELSSMGSTVEQEEASPETSPEPDPEATVTLSRSTSGQNMSRHRGKASRRHRNIFTCVFCTTPHQCYKKEDIR
jgi:hypothetical protein